MVASLRASMVMGTSSLKAAALALVPCSVRSFTTQSKAAGPMGRVTYVLSGLQTGNP